MGRTCVGRQIGMLGAPVGAIGGVIPWWDPLEEGLCIWAAYQPVGAADFAASLLDLSGNGNDAADPGGADTPAWNAANGWIFDGVSDYLTTAWVPENDQSQSAIVQFTGATGTFSTMGAIGGVGTQFGLTPRSNSLTFVYENGTSASTLPPLAVGNIGLAGNQGYRNGVVDGGAIGAWTGPSVLACYIGATNITIPFFFFTGSIQAMALYDCTLTAPQMLAVATAMAALS